MRFLARFKKANRDSKAEVRESSLSNSPVASGSQNTQIVNAPVIHGGTVNFGSGGNRAASSAVPLLPNIEYAGCGQKQVFISPLPQQGICDPRNQAEREKSVQALVLKFENRVVMDRKIAHAPNVIAKVKFRTSNGTTERSLNYGVWLNASSDNTAIGIGDVRELVLMCMVGEEPLTFGDKRGASQNFDYGFTYIDDGHVEGFDQVEVTVIDKKSQAQFSKTFKVWRQGGSFCVAPR